MSVTKLSITAGPYAGNDAAVAFPFNFMIFDKEDIDVYRDDGDGAYALDIDVDYTVTFTAGEEGGFVTLLAAALPTGSTLFIRTRITEDQETSFAGLSSFYPEIHGRAFDKLTLLTQQILRKLSLMPSPIDDGSATADVILDLLASNKGVLEFDPATLTVSVNERAVEDVIALFYQKAESDARYLNSAGDTATGNIQVPDAVLPQDAVPLHQTAELIETRIDELPGVDPQTYIDYGLVSATVGNVNDYGSVI